MTNAPRPSRSATTAVAITLAAAAAATTSPAQAAGPVSEELGCRVYVNDTWVEPAGAFDYRDAFTLTVEPSAPEPGDVLTVTFRAESGPPSGPFATPAGRLRPRVVLELTGEDDGALALDATGPYPSVDVPSGRPYGTLVATGTAVMSAPVTSFALRRLAIEGVGGPGGDMYCSAVDASTVDPRTSPATSTSVVTTVRADDVSTTPSPAPSSARATEGTTAPKARPEVRASDRDSSAPSLTPSRDHRASEGTASVRPGPAPDDDVVAADGEAVAADGDNAVPALLTAVVVTVVGTVALLPFVARRRDGAERPRP